MDRIECPHCQTRVNLSADGTCPSCGGQADPLRDGDEIPYDPELDRARDKQPPGEALVTVQTFPTQAEAEVARLFLEDEGIPAFVIDAEIVSMDWFLGNAVGFVKLQVPTSCAAEAQARLEEHAESPIDGELSGEAASDPDPEDEEGPDEVGGGLLTALHRAKRPMIWLYLAPTLLAMVFAVAAAIRWALTSIIG